MDIEVKGLQRDLELNLLSIDTLHDDEQCDWKYVDDVIGEELDPKMVQKAWMEEMKVFGELGVYIYVKREVAERDQHGKLDGVRWVDVAKNDAVRSRLVAQ